jgi:uncharacterized protein YbjT (DUF2867 family)
MNDIATLRSAFEGAYGVYSVQNPYISGFDDEVMQGQAVADAAKEAGMQHVVYGSAGLGTKGTGIGSWETKLVIEEHMKALGLPLTILRPMAFMELMTDKSYYPAVSTWHGMPKLMGSSRKVVWLNTDDLGAIAAMAFADPKRFVGQDIKLASDVRSLDEARAIYGEVMGKAPRRFPMPVWLFDRIVGKDLTTMWRWLRTNDIDLDTGPTRAILPQAATVESWLRGQRAG